MHTKPHDVFIPQAGTVQLPIPVTKWLAVALRCFFCPQILNMFRVLQLRKLHKKRFLEGILCIFVPKRTTSPSESIRKPTSSVSRDERPPRLAGWLEGIWSVTWLGTSDFPGALQWDEAAEPAQFTGWGNMRSRRHNEQPSPAILGTRWEFWWNCPVADVTFPKYRLTVDNQMIGHWFFDFFPFCQWQFQWLQWQDMKHVLGHGRRQFWPETQWCITGLVVGGWTGGGTFWGIYSKLHQCAQSAASLESFPWFWGCVVSIVLSLMKLGTALKYFWWQLTHFLK